MVNIILSTYNGEKFIVEQLDSIFSQKYKDFHIYIRDDGSSDDTVLIIEKYIKDKDVGTSITFEKGENLGFCPSFFKLLKTADEGDYWAFCDQDDKWLPEKLELAVRWLDSNDNNIPLLYHGGFAVGNEDMSVLTPYPKSDFEYEFYNSITSNIFFGFSMVINKRLRQLLLMVNPRNIKYHDWFSAMITSAFGRYYMSDEVTAIHRQYNDNASPLYFFNKIPHGFKMLTGDRFYTMQAREFMRLYGTMLCREDQKVLEWFQMNKYSFTVAVKKTFYRKRWNPQIKVEIILRALMLIGIL